MSNTFQITRVPSGEEINFDALPVGKVTHYPLEKGSYKPYAQFSVCLSSDTLALRMMAFEAITTPESKVTMVFYPFANKSSAAVFVEYGPNKQSQGDVWIFHEDGRIPVAVEAHHHNGEDLQGIYWGWDILLPLSALEAFDSLTLAPGSRFPGNFYKIQTVSPEHYGSFAPANFAEASHFSPESMGEFQVLGY